MQTERTETERRLKNNDKQNPITTTQSLENSSSSKCHLLKPAGQTEAGGLMYNSANQPDTEQNTPLVLEFSPSDTQRKKL